MKQPNSFDTCLSCQVQHEHRSDQSDDVDQNHSKNSKRLPFSGERCFSLCQIAVLPCYKFMSCFFFKRLSLTFDPAAIACFQLQPHRSRKCSSAENNPSCRLCVVKKDPFFFALQSHPECSATAAKRHSFSTIQPEDII